jgi:hypothetical protein
MYIGGLFLLFFPCFSLSPLSSLFILNYGSLFFKLKRVANVTCDSQVVDVILYSLNYTTF